MKRLVACLFALCSAGPLSAYQYADFTPDQKQMLQNGVNLIWTYEDPGTRRQFTCVAALLNSPLPDVWAFLEKKELAPTYLNGLEVAKVVGREGDDILIFQQTRPSGIARAFKYTVKHHPIPYKRVEIERVSGDLRNIEGAWHFDAVEGKTLLVYQLHIDPGLLYPQTFVVNSQKQRLPQVMVEIRKRLAEIKEQQQVMAGGSGKAPKLVNSVGNR